MSATLDKETFNEYFDSVALVEVPSGPSVGLAVALLCTLVVLTLASQRRMALRQRIGAAEVVYACYLVPAAAMDMRIAA
eukprot:1360042-Amphidinium_carterae.1